MKKPTTTLWAALFGLLAISSNAGAVDPYFSVFGGASFGNSDLSGDSPTLSISNTAADYALVAGAAVGVRLSENLYFEGEITHRPLSNDHMISALDGGVGGPPISEMASNRTSVLAFLTNARWEVGEIGGAKISLLAGIGFGAMSINADSGSALLDEFRFGAHGGFAWQIGAGAAFPVSEMADLTVDYRYFSIPNAGLSWNESNTPGSPGSRISKDSSASSHNTLVGVRVRF